MNSSLKNVVGTRARVALSALIMASVVASQPSRAGSRDKNPSIPNVWRSSSGLRNTFNFRMRNGDVIVAKSKLFTHALVVHIVRKGSEDHADDTSTALSNVTEVLAPEVIAKDASDELKNLIKIQATSTSQGSLNLLIFKGRNGLLVVGQILDVSPAAYFTYFIDKKDASNLPQAELAYILPTDNGPSIGAKNFADLGLILGYQNGAKLVHPIRVPLNQKDLMVAPAAAVSRETGLGDEPFKAIPLVDGQFVVPETLRSRAFSSGLASSEELVGVDKARANRKRETSLKDSLKTTIFGQDMAIDRLVFNYGETLTNGMPKPKVLVLMGPSGVGKTYMGQEFARTIYGSFEKFLEVPGNEYSAHLGSLDYQKLLGSSGGVQGGSKGLLVEWLERVNGEGVLLINEGDKMHREVWLKLMELLDQGKISGQNGHPVDASKLIILITTNRGATRMFPPAVASWTQTEIDKQAASLKQDALKGFYLAKDGLQDDKSLPREVLNRIDEYVPFGPLSKEAAIKVAGRRAFELIPEYQRQYQLSFKVDPAALSQIALLGWTAADDARQIRKQVSSTMKQALDVSIDYLDAKNGDTVTVSFDTSDIRHPAYRVTLGAKSELIQGRAVVSNNPLKNKVLADQLISLEHNMKREVIGQDFTIDSVAMASLSHAMRPDKTRPLVIGLLGVSGNGKTETGRALANARYNGQISIISLGDISGPQDFDKNSDRVHRCKVAMSLVTLRSRSGIIRTVPSSFLTKFRTWVVKIQTCAPLFS